MIPTINRGTAGKSISNETVYRAKWIIVNPGKRLSLQKHQHGSEQWVVVQGSGQFTLNDQVRSIKTGDSLFIPPGAIQRVQNIGTNDLIIIETQLGLCLEDDIIR
ncbi:MAG TPA: phosphomannose isomerase type II C-terminal cupin domain [Anaerolineae bacterium]|nr:phosphomannose isomerase type II C-terminal cupin domain [Anaerolineae bacterium]